jgi:hypothetical protein
MTVPSSTARSPSGCLSEIVTGVEGLLGQV